MYQLDDKEVLMVDGGGDGFAALKKVFTYCKDNTLTCVTAANEVTDLISKGWTFVSEGWESITSSSNSTGNGSHNNHVGGGPGYPGAVGNYQGHGSTYN